MTNQRNHKRFSTCQGKRFDAQVCRKSEDETDAGQIIDISTAGARLALSTPVSVGEQLDVTLNVSALSFQQQRPATVCWAALRRDFLWHAGIQFATPLTDEDVDSLAGAGIIERRQSRRRKVSIPAMARAESSSDEHVVRIADMSSEGIGIVCPEPLEVDRRLMITISDDDEPWTLLAYVRSCTRRRRGHVIGCEFVDNDVYRHLRHYVARNRQPTERTAWARLRDYALAAVSTFLCVTVMTQWQAGMHEVDETQSEQQQLVIAAAEDDRLH